MEADSSARPIVFVQPFSVGAAGGGSRILRALLEHAPLPWRSVCTLPVKPHPWRDELLLPSRPSWGPLEHSRFAAWPKATAKFFRPRFQQHLRDYCLQAGARAIHTVPHAGLDFSVAQAVAHELDIPFFISLHDDLAYTTSDNARDRDHAIGAAWKDASACFVISETLGREYCRRYGEREFLIVTDGVDQLTPQRASADSRQLRIYFMGLFHMAYEENLRALLEGLALFERENPSVQTQVTLRCEHIRAQVLHGSAGVVVLPFADEARVQCDMQSADLLYMPMPFGAEHASFTRYSLSTKMVTYVGSGVPILYHGPDNSAAYQLLEQHRAALLLTTLNPKAIADFLAGVTADQRTAVAANALELARREFMLADQVRKFWDTITLGLTRA